MDEIIEEIINDPLNRDYTERGIKPILQADPEAKILIIGQAPGAKAEANQTPFLDASGTKLKAWMGIDDTVFYGKDIAILPMDFYFPGKGKTGDLPPRKEMVRYHEAFIKQMPHIQLTILIGAYSNKYYLNKQMKKNLTETVRCAHEYLPFYPIVHPSPLNARWQKKNPWFLEKNVPELQKLVSQVLENS
jgi:uracil-DNA glycosylase